MKNMRDKHFTSSKMVLLIGAGLALAPMQTRADNDNTDNHGKTPDPTHVAMESDTVAIEEVVVTTQKRRQTALEVPAAVSAMSGSQLGRLHVQQMDEMASFIPGLQVQIQSPNNPGYVIRGVTSDGGESYAQPRISAFMDGVSISRSRASVVEMYDLERVEVVKGPQGTLFGRGAEIGAMHILRNRPTNVFGGEITLDYGTHNQRGAKGYINTPIIGDRLSNRFAFSYDAHDGYIKNMAGGRLNGKSAIALRNSTRLFSGEHTVFDLILDYQHDAYPGTSFKSMRLAPEGGDTSPYTAAYLNGGRDLGIKRDVGGVTFLADHALGEYWRLNTITGFRAFQSDERFDADGTYLRLLDCREKERGTQVSQEVRLNYDNKGWFSGFVGASYFYEHSSQDVTLNTDMRQLYPAYIQGVFQKSYGSQISSMTGMIPMLIGVLGPQMGLPAASVQALQAQLTAQLTELNKKWFPANPGESVSNLPDIYGDLNTLLSSATGGMITMDGVTQLLASGQLDGVLAQYGVSKDVLTQGLGLLKGISGYALESDYGEQSTNYGTNQAVEIFADGTFHLAKGLSLTAGIRGTYEHQRTGYSSTSNVHPIFGTIMYKPSKGTVYTSDDYYSWVGRVALNYMLQRNNFYVSVSRGRRPGVIYFNNDPEKVVSLKPEIIVSYEAGVKGATANNRLGYELCAYYYDWSHFQTSRLESEGEAETMTRHYVADDAGKAHSFGIEAGLRYAITRNVSVFGNYSYIDGQFSDRDGNGKEQEYAGHRFRLTPEHSFALGADLDFAVSRSASVYFRPTYSYKSKVFFEDSNDPALTQKAYGLANFVAGVRLLTKGRMYYDISAYGKNVFNEKYLVDAGNSGNQIGYPTYVAGAPSVFGVQVKVGF